MDKLTVARLVETQKRRTLERIEAQRAQTRARFNTAPGLRQFTSPDEKPIRHTFRDETAWQGIARASR